MDNTQLTEEFLSEKVVTPVVLGMFANHEWDSIAIIRDPADSRNRLARIVVSWESVEVLVDYPGNTESLFEIQQRLVTELRTFIDHSEFGARRDDEWVADDYNAGRSRTGLFRPLRPDFIGPAECTLRRRRIGSRVMRIDRRRCLSSHRRS